MKRIISWSHEVNARWFGNGNKFVLSIPNYNRQTINISQIKITQFNEVEIEGFFSPMIENNNFTSCINELPRENTGSPNNTPGNSREQDETLK
jgi:hypothetical protein